jgi:regulatory protein
VGKITALRVGSTRNRVSVFVDGSFSFATDKEIAIKGDLQVGQDLSVDCIEELKQATYFQSCLDAALNYLSYRPRSEAEVRLRLLHRGFDEDMVGKIIEILKELKVVDDAAFSEFWKNNRRAFSPRSRDLIKLELRQKGIAADMADEIVGDLDDENSAYEAGLQKMRSLVSLDYNEFRRWLSGYLRRRGFSYEVVGCVVKRLWREQQAASV